MRKMLRCTALLLSAWMLLLTLTGCRQDDGEAEPNRNSEIDLSAYTVVYSDKAANSAEKTLAVKFRTTVLEKYGVELAIATDAAAYDSEAKQILVGHTAYPPTGAASDDITRKDYTVRYDGNQIVLLGGDADGLSSAIDYFLGNAVVLTDQKILTLRNTDPYTYRYTYASAESALSVVSLNLRTATSASSNNQGLREPRIVNFLSEKLPDSVGFQECTVFWRTRLDTVLEPIGYERAQPIHNNPQAMKNYIWYRKDTVKLCDSGYFWLSETPDFASQGFGSEYYISAAWAILENRETGVRYVHINTHLDAYHEDIRIRELEVLMQHVRQYSEQGLCVFLTGDFNSTPNSPIYETVTKEMTDTRKIAVSTSSKHTYNAYSNDESAVYESKKTIDYCFCFGDVSVESFEVFEKSGGGYLSDHNALLIRAVICKR